MLKKLYRMWQDFLCPHYLWDDSPTLTGMWWRCQYGCPWCDYMQKWWGEGYKSIHRPPYR